MWYDYGAGCGKLSFTKPMASACRGISNPEKKKVMTSVAPVITFVSARLRIAFAAGSVALGNKVFTGALVFLLGTLFHIGNAGAALAVELFAVGV